MIKQKKRRVKEKETLCTRNFRFERLLFTGQISADLVNQRVFRRYVYPYRLRLYGFTTRLRIPVPLSCEGLSLTESSNPVNQTEEAADCRGDVGAAALLGFSSFPRA